VGLARGARAPRAALLLALAASALVGSGCADDTLTDDDATSESSEALTGGGSPYSGTPAALPGTVQAENFDRGGEGVAYHDTTAGNLHGAYRNANVDIRSCPDTGGGYEVTHFASGEWLAYTVNVTTAGTYNFSARVASAFTGTAFRAEVDGVNVTGKLVVPNTGSWSTFTDVPKTGIALSAGVHVVRIVSEVQWFDFNSFRFELAAPSGPTGGLITNFTSTRYSQFQIDGVSYSVLTVGKSHSLQQIDNRTLRFEVRQGDSVWCCNNETAEVQRAPKWNPGTPVTVEYQFMLEPGATNTASWFVTSEFHNDDGAAGVATSPPVVIQLAGERLQVAGRYCPSGLNPSNAAGNLTYMTLWTSPVNIVRGQYYDIKMQTNISNNSSGYLNVWVNGVQVVNYRGMLGYGYQTYYMQGLYRSSTPEAAAARVRNLTVGPLN
jgi:hypothetical protein